MSISEKDVYLFYTSEFQPIYSEIEAITTKGIPVELLFEIHAAFNHLSRVYSLGEDPSECAQKAFSHIKRGVLDAYKLKLYFFNNDLADLKKHEKLNSRCDTLERVKAQTKIIEEAKKARITESQSDKKEAFSHWKKVSEMIDSFKCEYFK